MPERRVSFARRPLGFTRCQRQSLALPAPPAVNSHHPSLSVPHFRGTDEWLALPELSSGGSDDWGRSVFNAFTAVPPLDPIPDAQDDSLLLETSSLHGHSSLDRDSLVESCSPSSAPSSLVFRRTHASFVDGPDSPREDVAVVTIRASFQRNRDYDLDSLADSDDAFSEDSEDDNTTVGRSSLGSLLDSASILQLARSQSLRIQNRFQTPADEPRLEHRRSKLWAFSFPRHPAVPPAVRLPLSHPTPAAHNRSVSIAAKLRLPAAVRGTPPPTMPSKRVPPKARVVLGLNKIGNASARGPGVAAPLNLKQTGTEMVTPRPNLWIRTRGSLSNIRIIGGGRPQKKSSADLL
ncbi:hypothetical protein MKEN_00301100 [Mycena kentingensis (nom. inval.)]|nr:hypothetical protein MKEN_00301100 [Mycena kentingensis (nom. inval.)]